jgi:hypothetical protein
VNAYLSRRSCAKPNSEQAPINGWLLAAVAVYFIALAVAFGVHKMIAAVIQ